MSKKGKWDITVVGETMASRPFSMHDEPEFLGVVKLMRESDLTYAHLEMNFGEFDKIGWPAKSYWFGSYMLGEPRIADDLKWAGVDMISCAHNHSLDFGVTGMMSTINELKRCGITCAGTGMNLEAARGPAYLEKKQGRVALISASSGNGATEWAGLPKDTMPGRPGINPLRASMQYEVDQETAEQLKMIYKKLGILITDNDGMFGINAPHAVHGEYTRAFNKAFIEGDGFKIRSACHKGDLEGNLRSIDEAMKMADLVLVAHHFNISEGERGDRPPQFAQEFAKAAIDAGADMYLGHGWHNTMGVEIYKGKPIFYGLGNFFAQTEFLQKVPYDSYETWGHNMEKLTTLTPAATPLHPGLDKRAETWWSSALLKLEIEDHQLKALKLYPVEEGRDVTAEGNLRRRTGSGSHALTEGRPFLADKDNGERILNRLKRLSAEFGSTIDIKDGVGVLRLS